MDSKEVFDAEDLLDTFMEDADKAKAMLAHFVERTDAQLEKLPALCEGKNWEEARRTAHTIKGAARTLSGTELGNVAARLEKAYKEEDTEEIKAAFPLLQAAFTRYKKAAEPFLQS